MTVSIGRNDPCPCASGQKYKRCCLGLHECVAAARRRTRAALVASSEIEDYAEEVGEQVDEIVDALEGERFDEAGGRACDLLEHYPQEADGLEMLGHVHAALGERAEALAWYRKALGVVHCVYAPGESKDLHEEWLRRVLHAVEHEAHRSPWRLSIDEDDDVEQNGR